MGRRLEAAEGWRRARLGVAAAWLAIGVGCGGSRGGLVSADIAHDASQSRPERPADDARAALPFAPDLRGKSLRGERVALTALRGKVVVLDVMASWCGTCLTMLPRFEALAGQARGDRLVLILISQDEALADIQKLVARRGIEAPVVLDEDERWWGALGCSALPTAVVIGGDGRLVLRRHGLGQGGFADVEAAVASELARLDRP